MHSEQNTTLHILLADDDLDDCFFFEKVLKEIPIATHLTIVSNGERLMEYLSKNSKHLPDILFLDLSMPRKTGFECLIEIKEDRNLKNLPVIMFSTSFTRGLDFEQQLKTSLSGMGAQDYIRKPADFGQLKPAIHKALKEIEAKINLLKEKSSQTR